LIRGEDPQKRIAFVLTDANVTVLLTQRSLLPALPAGVARPVAWNSFDWLSRTDARTTMSPSNRAT